MSSINHTTFTGRITHTPELKTTPNGKSVCSFSIAVENGYGDNKKVVYPTIVAWNGQAEFVSKLAKGTKIAVVCRYDERSWQKKDGEKRKAYEFIASEIEAQESKRVAEQSQADSEAPPPSDFEEVPPGDDLPF